MLWTKSDLESSSLSISESISFVCSWDPFSPDPSAVDHCHCYVTKLCYVGCNGIDHYYHVTTIVIVLWCYRLTTASPLLLPPAAESRRRPQAENYHYHWVQETSTSWAWKHSQKYIAAAAWILIHIDMGNLKRPVVGELEGARCFWTWGCHVPLWKSFAMNCVIFNHQHCQRRDLHRHCQQTWVISCVVECQEEERSRVESPTRGLHDLHVGPEHNFSLFLLITSFFFAHNFCFFFFAHNFFFFFFAHNVFFFFAHNIIDDTSIWNCDQ